MTRRKARMGRGTCEFTFPATIAHPDGRRCTRKTRFWVQRGGLGRMACRVHVGRVVEEIWSLAAGWHGRSEVYEGTLLTDRDRIQVRMTESGEVWK